MNRPVIYYRLSNTALGMVMETNPENKKYTPLRTSFGFYLPSICMRMEQHEENRSKTSLPVPLQDQLLGHSLTTAENQSHKNLIQNIKIQIKTRTVKH